MVCQKHTVLWGPQNVSLPLHPNIQVNRQYVVQPHLKTLDILLKTLNMVSGQSSCMHALYLHVTSATTIIVMIIFSPCVSKGPAL